MLSRLAPIPLEGVLMFANLHTHTDYSILDGMMTVKSVFETGKELGYSALAITEHANLSSLFLAVKESKTTGLKYIPGIEFNIKESPDDLSPRHLVVLASDKKGLQSIMRVAYASYDRDVNKPYILWDDLGNLDVSGVYVLSGCCDGLLAVKTLLYGPRVGEEIVDRFATLFGDRFLIEVNIPYDDKQGDVNALLTDLATRKGVRRVLALDSHFKSESDGRLFNIFLAIQNKGSVYDRDSLFYTRPHMMGESEVRRLAGPDMADAVDLSGEIASACADPVDYLKASSVFLMPKFDVESASDYSEFLEWEAGQK